MQFQSVRPFEFYNCSQCRLARQGEPGRRPLTLSAHWALPLGRVLLYPLQDAVLLRSACVLTSQAMITTSVQGVHPAYHVEVVSALARYYHAQLAVAHLSMKGGLQSIHRLQSSPGYLHVGQVPSKCTWQMPHTSSSGMSQRQVATAFHFLIVTFIVLPSAVRGDVALCSVW